MQCTICHKDTSTGIVIGLHIYTFGTEPRLNRFKRAAVMCPACQALPVMSTRARVRTALEQIVRLFRQNFIPRHNRTPRTDTGQQVFDIPENAPSVRLEQFGDAVPVPVSTDALTVNPASPQGIVVPDKDSACPTCLHVAMDILHEND